VHIFRVMILFTPIYHTCWKLSRPIQAQLQVKESVHFDPSAIGAHQQHSSIIRSTWVRTIFQLNYQGSQSIVGWTQASATYDHHQEPSLTQLMRFCHCLIGPALKKRSLNYLFLSAIPKYDSNAYGVLQYSNMANVQYRHHNLTTHCLANTPF
jgi:hypothetical protein